MPSREFVEAIAVTAELCGRTFSEAAARVFVDDLAGFPEPAVMTALRRCRREVRGLLTVQDVVSRLDDGRPGPEEAWAMLPKSESDSAVWTDEMSQAFGVASRLLEEGDPIAARMAFREAYTTAVNRARDERRPPNWTATLGHDPRGREAALAHAADKGRISLSYARSLTPRLGTSALHLPDLTT